MKVTLEYVVLNIVFQTILAVAIAVLMQRLTKKTVVRAVILLPFLISNVIAALVWFLMLDYQVGIVERDPGRPRAGPDHVLRRRRHRDPDHRDGQRLARTWATPPC